MLLMELFRFVLSICLLTFCFKFLSPFKNFVMRQMKFAYSKIKFTSQKIYRLLNVKNAAQYVWKELIEFHSIRGRKFGQYDNDQYIECSFPIDDTNYVHCYYAVSFETLTFRSIILPSFDEEITNDILVLASHFNGLLTFGVVKVSIKYNYVEVLYSRDVLTYSLFPGEIESDTNTHFKLTKDCFWSFTNLIETGDDPVFVFSELLKRKEEDRIDVK